MSHTYDVINHWNDLFQDGGLLPGEEDQLETQKLLDEIDKLRNELILEQQKKSSLNNEDVQVKEKLYQETKSRANKAEQEVEAQKVRLLVRIGIPNSGMQGRLRPPIFSFGRPLIGH